MRSELEEPEIEDVFGVLKKVPILSVELSLKEDSDEDSKSTNSAVKIDPRDTQKWIRVKPDTHYACCLRTRTSTSRG